MQACRPEGVHLTLGGKRFPRNRRRETLPLVLTTVPLWALLPGPQRGAVHTVGAQLKLVEDRMEKGRETQRGILKALLYHPIRGTFLDLVALLLKNIPWLPGTLAFWCIGCWRVSLGDSQCPEYFMRSRRALACTLLLLGLPFLLLLPVPQSGAHTSLSSVPPQSLAQRRPLGASPHLVCILLSVTPAALLAAHGHPLTAWSGKPLTFVQGPYGDKDIGTGGSTQGWSSPPTWRSAVACGLCGSARHLAAVETPLLMADSPSFPAPREVMPG